MGTVLRVKIELGIADPATRFVAVRRLIGGYGGWPEHWRLRSVIHPSEWRQEWVEMNHRNGEWVLLERWGTKRPLSTLRVRMPNTWDEAPWEVGEARSFDFTTETAATPRGSVRITRMPDYEVEARPQAEQGDQEAS